MAPFKGQSRVNTRKSPAIRARATGTTTTSTTSRTYCESCEIYLDSNISLRRHNIMTHVPIRSRKQTQPFGYSEIPVGAENEHDEAHAELKNETQELICPDCEEIFDSESVLLDHEKTHNEIFKCDYCMADIRRADFLAHLSSEHVKDMAQQAIEKPDKKVKKVVYKTLREKRFVYQLSDGRSQGPDQLYLCTQCWPVDVFIKKSDLEQHLMSGSHVNFRGANRIAI